MCGRYSITTPEEAVRRHFGHGGPPRNLAPRYNAAPSQDLPVVRIGADSGRELAMLRWGLIPSWAEDARIGDKLINARAETLAQKPSFRAAFRHRRCLVPADGFYEWKREGNGKQPYRVTLAGGGVFAFAGLWERWQGPDGPVESFTIVTTEAASPIAHIEPRMPAILDPDAYDAWLDTDRPLDDAMALLRPAPAERLRAAPVSARVNDVRNDDPGIIAPPDEGADAAGAQGRLL